MQYLFCNITFNPLKRLSISAEQLSASDLCLLRVVLMPVSRPGINKSITWARTERRKHKSQVIARKPSVYYIHWQCLLLLLHCIRLWKFVVLWKFYFFSTFPKKWRASQYPAWYNCSMLNSVHLGQVWKHYLISNFYILKYKDFQLQTVITMQDTIGFLYP